MERGVSVASFPAMSTTVEITGVEVAPAEVDAAAARGQALFEAWDRAFSRFRLDSELSMLNAAGGRPVTVSDMFLAVLDVALAGAALTGNRFDPAILPALERAGYDRDIAEVTSRATPVTPLPPAPAHRAVHEIEIDRRSRTVKLPAGMRIDLGGIAKGAFVDRLAAELAHWPGGCVDAGGDLRVWGVPPSGDRWVIGIEDPTDPDLDLAVAEIRSFEIGIATSGTNRRRWLVGNREVSHLIDSATGRPIPGPIRSATAIAKTVAAAEIAAKALLVAEARGERLQLFGCEQAVLLTAAADPGLPPWQRPEVGVTILEGPHENPCIVHQVDTAEHTA